MKALEVLTALLLYGAFHSAAATAACKARVARWVGERAFRGLYRLSYSIVSVFTFLPVLSLVTGRSEQSVWDAEGAIASALLATRVVAGIGLATALLQIDVLRFLGIKEALAYFRGRSLPLPPERLVTRGVYRLVRHPLYLSAVIALWSSPVMTEAALGLALGATLYFALGSILEERKMASAFGPEYEAYRKTVPWLFPFAKRGG